MEEEETCCPASAARKIKKIEIDGLEVGIAQLGETISKVAALGLTNEKDVGQLLLKETKIYNYVPTSKESGYRLALLKEYARGNNMVSKIEVLGTGCAKCKLLEKNVLEAVKDLGLKIEVVKIDDFEEIIRHGLTMTPGLIIDGQTVAIGRVPGVDEIKAMISAS